MVVEAAFASPVVLFLLMALVDLGLFAFRASVASSAARDGARAAMLWPTDLTAIRAAATEHVAEQVPATVTRTCTGTCVPGTDRVTVTVSFPYQPVTFVGAWIPYRTIQASSTVLVVGSPLTTSPSTSTPAWVTSTTTTTTAAPTTTVAGQTTTTTAPTPTTTTTAPAPTTTQPGACAIQSVVITGAPFGPRSNGKLENDLVASVQTNGAAACVNLKLRVYTGAGTADPETVSLTGSGSSYGVTIDKNAYSTWTDGNHTVEILNNVSTLVYTTTVTV